ncbi:MAG: hypothetical protein ACJ74O_18180 [Frankiaceae bacterium]
MDGLPALLNRPAAVLPPAGPAATVPGETVLRIALDSGVPARIPLAGDRALVLAAGPGRARCYLDADPAAVVIAIGAVTGSATAPPAAPALLRNPDALVPRLTLLDRAALGDSVPVVAGVAMTLSVGGRAIVEVTVDALTVTAGSLRSPGQYGSSMTLRWRDLTPAGNAGPPLATGDPSIPRPRLLRYRRFVRRWVE